MSLFPRKGRDRHGLRASSGTGTSARDRARALFLAALVGSQFISFAAPVAVSAGPTVASSLSVGLYHGNGGSSYQGFNGNGSAYPNPQDLTQWGTGDWRLWGADGSTSPSGIEQAHGRSLISDLGVIAPDGGSASGLAAADGSRPFTFQWTGGNNTPSGTGSDVLAGVKPAAAGAGSGFSLTIPLPKDVERLRLWVSAYDGTGVLTASVPGLPPITNSDMVGKNNDHGGVFEIDVKGTGDLNVTYRLTCPQNGGCTSSSHVTMYAAAYTWTGEPPAFSVDVANGQPDAFTLVQGNTDTDQSGVPLTTAVTTSVINGPVSSVDLAPAITTDAGDSVLTCGSSGLDPCLTASVNPSSVQSFPATSAVMLHAATDIPAGIYHVTITGMESGGADDVNTANLTVTVLPLTQVPFLYRAFPNDSGGVTVTGVMHADPNQTYRIQLFTATTCDANRVAGGIVTGGPVVEVPTDDTGLAFIGHAVSMAQDTTYVTAQAISYETTAPDGTTSWTDITSTTDRGPCIVVSDPNESWPWAKPITAGSNGLVSFGDDQYVDDLGRSRWYMFPVRPGSKVHVTISGLPKDFDVYLFRDILQAYQAGGSLLQQTASYAPPSYAPPSYAPPSYAPDSYAPPSYAPPSYAPPSYAPPSYAPPSYAPPSYAPPSYAPPSYAPPSYAPPSYAPPSYATDAWAPPSYAPPSYAPPSYASTSYAGAQNASLIGWNVDGGTLSATIDASTWTNTGDFYVRVNGKSGLYDITHSFHIAITTDASVCEGVAPLPAPDDPVNPTPARPSLDPASTAESLIIWDSSRITGNADATQSQSDAINALRSKLDELAARSDVNGAVVDVAGDTRVQTLNGQADSHASCVYAKNLVADEIKDIVSKYREGNPALRYVVLVGGDGSIPFFRYPDPAYLGPESDYVPPVKTNSPSEATLGFNYVLGQDEYGSTTVLSIGAARIPIPDLAVGRLVETAADAIAMIDAYSPATAGDPLKTLAPSSALETGYDFLADTAHAVSDQLQAGMGSGATNDELISEYGAPQTPCPAGVDPGTSCSWTADQLRAAILGQRHDLIFLGGHFSANEALAADFTTRINVSELAASPVDLARSVVFSNGCHSGYNIVNGDAIPGVTEPLDWAEAFAQKGATLIAGTGYQYGDTDFLEYSERIYAEFAHQLRVGTGPVAVGDALVASKIFYMSTTQSLSGLHEKAILESALFGLPMFKVDMPDGRGTTTGSGAQPLTFNPSDTTGGLTWTDLNTGTGTVQHNKTLDVLNADGSSAGNIVTTWFSGPSGESINPGDPVLPLDVRNVTQPDKVLRGVAFLGGTYSDKTSVDVTGVGTVPVVPLTATAGTELGGTHLGFGSPTFYPERPWSVNYFDELAGSTGVTNLLLTPAQHRAVAAGGDSALLRLYSNLDVRMYYLDSSVDPGAAVSTALAPSISDVSGTLVGDGQVTFKANVIGDPFAGTLHAWITYTLGPDSNGVGTWISVPLDAPAAGSSAWTATAASVPGVTAANLGNLRFMAQAVSTGGAVSLDTNFGQYYRAGDAPSPSSISLALASSSGTYGQVVHATATLTPADTGKTIIFKLGTATRTADTVSGVAAVDLPLQATPGQYTATATFVGDDSLASSLAVQPFTIDKLSTTTTISHDDAYPLQAGAESGVTALVKDTIGNPIAFRTMFFVVDGFRGDPTDPSIAPFGYTVARLTDATGTAHLGPIPTPFAGGKDYVITAYYASTFTSVPDGSPVDARDLIYDGSSAALPVSGTITIAKGTQTITFDTIPPKVFGDAPFTVTATASSGLPVSFSASGACSNVGAIVTIDSAGDCVVTASQDGDGTWAPAPDVEQTVSTAKAAAVVTLGDLQQTYDGTAKHATATTTPDGLAVTFTYDGDATEPTDAGTYTVVATVQDAGYQGTATGSLIIDKAGSSVVIDCTTGAPFTYTGSAITPCDATGSGVGLTPFPVTPVYGNNVGAGTATADASWDGDANHYGSTADQATFDIKKASLTVTPDAKSVQYGDPVPAYTFGVTGFVSGESAGTAAGYTAPTCSSTYTPSTSATAGPLTIACSGGAANNYSFSYNTALVMIGKAPLTITASSASISFGGTVPAITAGYSGFVNGETAAALTTQPTCSTTATGSSGAGQYPTSCSGAASANYAISYVPGTLTINPASTSMSLAILPQAPNGNPQFSDTVTLQATVSPAAPGTVSFQLNGKPVVPLTASVNGSGVAQATLRLDGTVLPLGANSYSLTASYVPSSSNYASTTASGSFAIQREGQQSGGQADGTARIDYSGTWFLNGGNIPTLTATVVQDAETVDFAVTPVTVSFSVYPATCSSLPCTWGPPIFTRSGVPVAGAGVASVTPPAPLPEGAYIVVVTADPNSFILPMAAISTFVVSSTGNTFISGGGYVTTDSTSNSGSNHGYFAFNSSKSSGTVSGSVAYVYRMRIYVDGTGKGNPCTVLGPTANTGCRDVDVVIRSAGLATLNAGQKGYLTGTVTVEFLDAANPSVHYAGFEYAGGDFRLDIVDNSQQGATSELGFTAYQGNKVFHQAYIPASKPIRQGGIKSVTNTVLIGAGYISSHP